MKIFLYLFLLWDGFWFGNDALSAFTAFHAGQAGSGWVNVICAVIMLGCALWTLALLREV